jgi:hypothetical protein
MEGYGNRIKAFKLDGKVLHKAELPADLKGLHMISIVLANSPIPPAAVHHVANYTTLPAPNVKGLQGKIEWRPVQGATAYKVIKNGKLMQTITGHEVQVQAGNYAAYQVMSVDPKGIESFASEPFEVVDAKKVKIFEAEDVAGLSDRGYKGFSGKGFSEISVTRNKEVNIPVAVEEDGMYAIDFYYSNGNGPTNTENKCAIRTIKADGKVSGTVLFPQRGKEEWSSWGYSNAVKVPLKKGKHIISLVYEDRNENMNGVINQAMIDYLRLIKIDLQNKGISIGARP